MKRFFCFFAALTVLAVGLKADEGMWLLPLLERMNANALNAAGCRLTPEQIYSVNHSSLKDAVVQFGGGCTGEIISDEGLLVTNHHCGYGSIQKLSSMEHDYLTNGYWAMNRSEELPVQGLSVTFIEYMEDLTQEYESAYKSGTKMYRDSSNVKFLAEEYAQDKLKSITEKAEKDHPNCRARVQGFYDKNVYYLIVSKEYKDVRFVGAPPSSIGKFGADTDNWMWPRHTCDFSMFRVYAGPDNEPAEYSEENVPLRPKQSLKVSLKGVEEGDFAMVLGFPGRTNRFQTSAQLKNMLRTNDIVIAARTVRQDVLLEDMLADPQIKIQYASKYSGSTNAWKKYQGMKLAFEKLDILGRTEAEEAAFMDWVNKEQNRVEKYGTALDEIAAVAAKTQGASENYILLLNSIGAIEISQYASTLSPKMDSLMALAAFDRLERQYKDYSVSTDRKVAKAVMKFYRDNVAQDDCCIEGLAEMDIDAFVDNIFDNSVFTSFEKLSKAVDENGLAALEGDPVYALSQPVSKAMRKYMSERIEANKPLEEPQKAYTAGLMEWRAGAPSYPDANFTMRLTYGNVKSYSPQDAVIYKYYTTLDGVMEKEDPDNWEFVVPAKLKELWKAKDYGEYARKDGSMPACFLTTNDITGGNSGSPVMNGDGELIGLAFDGNWESMSSDVMFEPDLQRCIAVDIRYVLFVMDKFGGAGYLLDEMNITK